VSDNASEEGQKPIYIVGGGFAGTAMLVHMALRIAEDDSITSPVQIRMVESNPKQMHRGLAYGKAPTYEKYNLNIASKRANPFRPGQQPPDVPSFPEYIRARAQDNPGMIGCLTDPPRQMFGDYLEHLVGVALEKAGGKIDFERVNGKVTRLDEKPGHVVLKTADGATADASQVILATGFRENPAQKRAKILENPYSEHANEFFAEAAGAKGAKTLIIGTGLTALDAAARLINSGYQGKIKMLSRRALMHKPYEDTPPDEYMAKKMRGDPRPESDLPFTKERPPFMEAKTLKSFVRGVVREYRRLEKEGYGSEEILSYWERFVPEVTRKFGHNELAGLFAANETVFTAMRVGVTPEISRTIRTAMKSGQLEIQSASVQHIAEGADGKMKCAYMPGKMRFNLNTLTNVFNTKARAEVTESFDYVISANGHGNNYDVAPEKLSDPLWKDLLGAGKSVPHWTGSGIAVAQDFALLDAEGKASERVRAVGVPVAGHMAVTDYPYTEKPGAGGRLGPMMLNISCITAQAMAFLGSNYKKMTAPFKGAEPAPAAYAAAARPAKGLSL
jgi:uncharacterized NAD(P)/FAD-binding protein YdhS